VVSVRLAAIASRMFRPQLRPMFNGEPDKAIDVSGLGKRFGIRFCCFENRAHSPSVFFLRASDYRKMEITDYERSQQKDSTL